MHTKRLIVAILLLVFAVAWGLYLPRLAQKFAWIGGKNGVCPIRLVLVVALACCTITIVFCVVSVISLNLNRKSAFLLGGTLCVIGMAGTILSIQRMAVSGKLLQAYCSGLSETIGSKVDVASLYEFFSDVVDAEQENQDRPYVTDRQAPINQILPNRPPVVVVYSVPGKENSAVIVLWKCSGGGFGIVYGDAPPPKRSWLDESVVLTDRIFIVTRRE